jgi:hypothetical protein
MARRRYDRARYESWELGRCAKFPADFSREPLKERSVRRRIADAVSGSSGFLNRRVADGERLPALPCGRREFSHPGSFAEGLNAVFSESGRFILVPSIERAAGKKFPAALSD